MNKKTIIISIAIVLFIALAVLTGYVYFLKIQSENQATFNQNTSQSNSVINTAQAEQTKEEGTDTSDWKTYRNEEYGLEFKYPKDWIESEGSETNYYAISIRKAGWQDNWIDIHIYNQIELNTIINQTKNLKNITIKEESASKVGNINVKKIIYSIGKNYIVMEEWFYEYNNKIYDIRIPLETTDISNNEYIQYSNLFISSFKII